jgi:hypothetical protein
MGLWGRRVDGYMHVHTCYGGHGHIFCAGGARLRIVLRAGRNSPPAVKAAMPSPRAPSIFSRGQQIRCNSGADGHSPDERERDQAPLPARAAYCACACLFVASRNPEETGYGKDDL